MGNPFKLLDKLRTNIYGGGVGSTTDIARQSTIELADTSPIAKLKKDPMAFSSLSYPRDLINDITNGHYMLFYINVQNKTKFPYTRASDGVLVPPTTVKQVYKETPGTAAVYDTGTGKVIPATKGTKVATGQEDVSGGAIFEEHGIIQAMSKYQTKLYGDVATIRKSKTKMRTGLAKNWNPTTRITDSVAIYLPPNVQDNYTTQYTGTETGMLGFLAAGGAGVRAAYQNNDFDQVAQILLGSAGALFEDMAKRAGLSVAEMLSSAEGGYELTNKVFGRSTNPYMEVLFNGPDLRTFNYNFTFAPRNAAEQAEVKKIIHLFRFHQAPELRSDHNMFLGLPSEFDIHYMYQDEDGSKAKENPFYNKIATCVLQSVKVDYTPGAVQSHSDGSPVQIKMSLEFLETEMITKDHIEAGY